jgi:NAD(P)-dependent dehydrogenase (short-subunit alcohol dehydrogenase family)
MAHDFTGKRVLITGGAGGIGYATAEAFLAAGAKVAICDRNTEALEAAVANLGDGAVGIECDLGDSASIASCVTETVEKLGGIDVLVNNAGIGEARSLVDCDDDFIDAILNVNLRGVMLMTRESVKVMKQQGSGAVVNISSLAVKRPSPNSTHYTASKAGVLGFTISLAVELAPTIRVNAICPGMVETAMMTNNIRLASERQGITKDEAFAQRQAMVPMGRLQQPEDIARGVLFLASDESSEIIGEALNITGGMATW